MKFNFLPRIITTATALAVPTVALAEDPTTLVNKGVCESGLGCSSTSLFGSGNLVANITSSLIFIVGAISVIMIVVGGFRLVTSAGNPANIKSARDTIVYSVVGVVVAVLAYAIVRFVLNAA